MIETFLKIASVVFLVWCALARPVLLRCPVGWHGEGVRLSGRFECVRDLHCPRGVDCMEWDGTWRRPDRSTQPPGRLSGRIYCTGGAVPVVIDERTVGCQRVHQ